MIRVVIIIAESSQIADIVMLCLIDIRDFLCFGIYQTIGSQHGIPLIRKITSGHLPVVIPFGIPRVNVGCINKMFPELTIKIHDMVHHPVRVLRAGAIPVRLTQETG